MTAVDPTAGDRTGDGPDADIEHPKRRSWRRLRRRFLRRPSAVLGLVLATGFVLLAVFAPLIAPYGPGENHFEFLLSGPNDQHWFGTDELGRDTFSRTIWGTRASMQASVMATALAMLVAVPLGMMAGYFRGWLDSVIMRLTDTALAFPSIILAVGLAAIYGPSLTNASVAIAVGMAPQLVRITRSEVLSAREEDYVAGAIANGAGDWVIIKGHILPNIRNTLLVQATVMIPTAILVESALSFLGLGVQAPMTSWGVILSNAQPFLRDAPWLWQFPGAAIFLAALSFNLLGDGLRDVLDPKAVR